MSVPNVVPSTFDRFSAQLHATGRERMDGFDRTHLDGLTPVERVEARRLLVDALRQRDTTAAHGLVLLDGADAVSALDNALAYFAAPTYERAVIAGELWRLTGDPAYADVLAALVVAFTLPDDRVRRAALVYLEDTKGTPTVTAALKRAVREEPNENLRFLAVVELFYLGGLVGSVGQTPRPHPELIDAVVHGAQSERERAADRIDEILGK